MRLSSDFSHPDFRVHWKALQRELWDTEMTSFNFDTCLIRKNGSVMWAHITTILIEDNNDTLGYTILEDISERKELERLKALVIEQEHRQQLAETILNTQEEERRRVSESLHNGLGQLLYGVKLSLSQVDKSAPGNTAAIAYTEQLLNDSIHECRRISHELIPAILEDYGLKEALDTVARQMNDGVKFNFRVRGLHKRIDRFLELAVYRIVQELILNIIKHAGASAAQVKVEATDKVINICVEDNGKGIEVPDQRKEGIGLQTIRYKVELLSGRINIVSAKDRGTKVTIRIPKRVD